MPAPDLLSAMFAAGNFRADEVDPDLLYFFEHVRPDGDSYVLEIPGDGTSPPVTIKYEGLPNDEVQSAPVPSPGRARSNRRMEEENPPADTPWYESLPDMDEDYREFFRHIRMENGRMVLEMGGKVVYYEMDEARSGGRSKAEREEKKGEEKKAPVAASGEEKVAVISLDGLVLSKSRVRDGRAHGQKVEEDQEGEYGVGKDEGKDGAVKDERKDVAGKDEEVGLDGPMVVVSKPEVCDRHAEPAPGQKIKVGNKKEKLLNEPTMVNTVNSETNSSNGHDAEPYIASGLHGVVWPTHIIERPESGFKERLMHVLSKPFSQGEYEKLFHRAIICKPVTKERRTRRCVKYYNSTHEKNKSYFDCYPDLAKQVEGASYPNQLALLRGLFFWLENVGHEDQFRPWRDDFTHYKVIPSME